MARMIESLFNWMDDAAEKRARNIAHRAGRRSFLQKAGWALVGGAVLPMLPYDNSNGMAFARGFGEPDELPEDCEYWRYCSLHGSLCSECGGAVTQCPPGTQPSKVAWVGTCRNPNDDKDYLVSYNDCCGKASVSDATFCFTSKGERPGYRMGLYNDINWCMANENTGYHCTVSVVVGLADQ